MPCKNHTEKALDDAPSKTPKTTEPHLNRRKMASEAGTARMLFVALGSPKEKGKNCKPNKAISRCWHGHGQGKNTRVKTAEPHLNRRKMASEASTARMLFRVAGTATAKEKTRGSKRQSPCMGKRLSLWSKSFGGRFRNTRTAAGFEPMPSKTQPDKMLPVTFQTHKKQFFCPAPSVRGWFRNHWRKSLGGGDPTKCLAHAKQNPAPQNASRYIWNP